jgi:hypothetical protein
VASVKAIFVAVKKPTSSLFIEKCSCITMEIFIDGVRNFTTCAAANQLWLGCFRNYQKQFSAPEWIEDCTWG